MTDISPEPNQIYQHYKGPLYKVLYTARHSETEETLVIYHPVKTPKDVWCRPLKMWQESVTIERKERPRFKLYKSTP